jgi:hypothetical protein
MTSSHFANYKPPICLVLKTTRHLQWSLLQSTAWTGMLVSNLSRASFSQAVQRTFDGKHPCCLCKAIAAGKKSEKKSQSALPLKRFEAWSQPMAIPLVPPASFPIVRQADSVIQTLPHGPPTPPPRTA